MSTGIATSEYEDRRGRAARAAAARGLDGLLVCSRGGGETRLVVDMPAWQPAPAPAPETTAPPAPEVPEEEAPASD